MSERIKIAVVVTARASWAKLQPVCQALGAKGVELQLVVCASALLERYGRVVDVIAQEFPIAERVYSTYEGATLQTSGLETGALLTSLSATFARLQPDVVVVCADRHEVLAAAQAASYQHIPLAHLQGGEKTGSIDDKVRDSITHLADYHFVCTRRAQMRVYGLTGREDRIWHVGCPSIDLAEQARFDPDLVTGEELGGSGPYEGHLHLIPSATDPFIVVLFHPVTNEQEQAGAQMRTVLNACERVHATRLLFWPGEDAGQEAMSKQIRLWTKSFYHSAWRLVRNLPPQRFLKLLTQATCVVGNSSVGIRECSYLGVPVVNIGTRQQGRERGPNVVDVPVAAMQPIITAIQRQMMHGPYKSSTLYGKGHAGERIAEVLLEQCAGVDTRKIG